MVFVGGHHFIIQMKYKCTDLILLEDCLYFSKETLFQRVNYKVANYTLYG